ncbi:MAG: hypothetical protein K1X38_17720 [Microthrixaceae bacterium]|nr:hypothetical protein [Microthrixaceae bacterium]
MDTFRLFLHVLAASVWVGGQIVLAGIVPTIRKIGPDAPKQVAQAFNRVAWPAYGVALVTGIWNMLVVEDLDQALFGIKFLLVLVSGAGAAVHIVGRSKAALAVGGALSSLGAVASMYVGLML